MDTPLAQTCILAVRNHPERQTLFPAQCQHNRKTFYPKPEPAVIRAIKLCLLLSLALPVPSSHAVPPGTGSVLDIVKLPDPQAAAEKKALAREASEAKVKVLERKLADEQAKRKAAEAAAAAAQLQSAREVFDLKSPPGSIIQDCPDCPKMVVIPAGRFTMGSPDNEVGRDPDEGPQHLVLAESFLIGQTEVTNAQFGAFTQTTGYQTDAERNATAVGCYAWDDADGKYDLRAGRSWRKPGWDIKDNQPAACVSWNDAKAYVDWLRQITGKGYQLPTEAQWEYAARAGSTTSRYWGDDQKLQQACTYANVADLTESPKNSKGAAFIHATRFDCRDKYWFVAPVATFKPNDFGLYDMLGNLWEWTQDCRNSDEYERRKKVGGWLASKTSKETKECPRVLRGGSWNFNPVYLRSAIRCSNSPDIRYGNVGFRLARTLLP